MISRAQRKEHSKTEFGKKNTEKKFGESETFYWSRFSPATGVRSHGDGDRHTLTHIYTHTLKHMRKHTHTQTHTRTQPEQCPLEPWGWG